MTFLHPHHNDLCVAQHGQTSTVYLREISSAVSNCTVTCLIKKLAGGLDSAPQFFYSDTLTDSAIAGPEPARQFFYSDTPSFFNRHTVELNLESLFFATGDSLFYSFDMSRYSILFKQQGLSVFL